MTVPEAIQHYGYFGVFFMSIFEGEPVLILGGIAAHEKLLNLPLVMVLSLVAGVGNDSAFFLLGKHHGERWLGKIPLLKKLFDKPHAFLDRNHRKAAFTVRFMYGFRIVVPFSLGRTSMSFRTFLIYNTLAALVWTPLFGLMGYWVGAVVGKYLDQLGLYQVLIFFGALIVGSVLHGLYGSLRRYLAECLLKVRR